MAEEPTATARFRAELTGAWAEFLASLFFVFFGAGSVCGAVKAVGEPVVVEPINYAASFGFAITFLAFAIGASASPPTSGGGRGAGGGRRACLVAAAAELRRRPGGAGAGRRGAVRMNDLTQL